MSLCSAPFITWTDSCTRSYFEALPSAALALFIICLAIPVPSTVLSRALKSPFKQFLTLPEAEALIDDKPYDGEPIVQKDAKPKGPLWRTVSLSGFALGETLVWLVIAGYRIVLLHGEFNYWTLTNFLNAFSWLPAVILPVLRPTVTPPYDLFAFYILQLIAGVFRFGVILYDRDTVGITLNPWDLTASILNLVVILALLFIVLRMPMNIPSSEEIAEKIGTSVSPEDYTPLWRWITFEWILPLIRKGTNETLNEPDVWNLSPTMQSKAVYEKFAATKRKSLFRRLIASNSRDVLIDFLLTIVSVSFNYGGPFFLNRVLSSITYAQDDPTDRARAIFYGFFMFLCTALKSESDLLHLWHGRRASTRLRSELMAAIYAKALVRKDYSGIVEKKDEKVDNKDKDDGKKKGKKKAKEEDPKNSSGADIGKIVNLMSGDANRIAMICSGAYFIYGAPFEIVIASLFLYQLLGLSAFAGFLCLAVASPLNNYLARRSVRIQKGVLAARDKRMGIVNELLNGVKLVKFYGWENRWVDRVLDARKFELKWLVKSRINQVMFSALWTSVPIFVSVVSFFTFVVTGHQLTIPVAFTSISLAPLNVIPTWIVQIMQTKVAMDRIETFLNEDEVSEQVSSLKRGPIDPTASEDDRLGILNASFKWNEVEEDSAVQGKSQSNGAGKTGSALPKAPSPPMSSASSTAGSSE
ncbi:hypothetical protein M422DRAFT_262419 [Sphaerobolus stellatus SS14]|uniref:ABC transmembrane type-1 domain-containing protein n=1 Tax=Sphaerobolus stellatus (strain SS14) TaxID=990650 RepID=A0A0C9VCK0_SPHS4|nr:hypothetical protein M422DRAFT_262419 [Sphaerobolus stellatus SS14]